MPTVHLSEIMNNLGTNSVRGLFQRTGSPEPSVFKQAQMAAIGHFYQKNGGFRGPFGFPLDGAHCDEQSAEQSFCGGKIRFQSFGPQGEDGPQGSEMTVVRVRFVGFHCIAEAGSDGFLTDSDEPYFIIGVAGANGSTTTVFGPYEDVDAGESRFEATDVVSDKNEITPPIVVAVFAVEKDSGTPEEAEEKVKKVMEGIVNKFALVAGLFSGGTSESHVMPEGARDILVGWLAEGIAALFGLADDPVGQFPMVLFDNKAELKEWKSPPVAPQKHGANEYNVIIPIDGGNQGQYELFFLVNLVKVTKVFQPE